MAAHIVQINFKYDLTRSEYEQAADQLAGFFAELSGLRWKVWILNEAESEAGGVYLFEDQDSMQSFLTGPLAAQVQGHPALRDFSVKTFEVMAGPTATTRGPV
jgi:hypothetical protein